MSLAILGTEDTVIDLSTLIALLTALASATTPGSSLPPGPAPDPPSQSCRAEAPYRPAPTTSGTSGTSGTSDRRPRTAVPETTDTGPTDQESAEPETTRPDTTRPDTTRPETTSHPARPDPPQTDRNLHIQQEEPVSDDEEKDTEEEDAEPTRTRQPESASDDPGDGESSTRQPETTRANDNADPSEPRTRNPQSTRSHQPPSTRTSRSGTSTNDDRSRAPGPDGRTDGGSTTGQRCDDRPRRPDSTAPRSPRPTGNRVPADVVDLGNWYLTLPTGGDGDPDTVEGPKLAGYSSSYFELNHAQDGVVFTAPVDGATTPNSAYPRSELREMNGEQKAAWSNGNGRHTLRATEAVTELPESKPEVVTAQIHGGDDDVMQIRLEGNHLMVQYADGGKQVTLDPDYRLGTPYDIEIVAAENAVQVGYNGEVKAELPLSGSTWYFKAGAYVQSNPTKGEAATAAGQVVIYSLEVTHT